MTEVINLIRPAAEIAADVVARAADADLSAPTPCTEFDLDALVRHLVGTTDGMARLGSGHALDPDNPWGAGEYGPDWPSTLQDKLAAIADGWSTPQAWEGSLDAGGSEMPAAMIGDMAFVEVLLHGWDLARATGQAFPVPDDIGRELRRAVTETAELGRQMGAYTDEVPVPESASDFDHALGAAGRDPGWTAPG